MIKVGITGGIGTGKSTVAKVFKGLGIPIYEADSRAKFIIENNSEIINKIKTLFGEEAYSLEGVYNKSFISSKVFNEPALLQKLNSVVHPVVGKDFEYWILKNNNAPYIIKEAAIMNKNTGLDKIIVVSSPLELRISRIQKRDGRNLNQIESILANQKNEKEYEEMADFAIYNNETEFIIPQVLAIDNKLKSQK